MTLNVVISGSRAEVLEYVYRQGLRDDLQVPPEAARGLDDATAGSEQCVVRLQVDLLDAGNALRRLAEPARGTDAAMAELAERIRAAGRGEYIPGDPEPEEHREVQ